LTYTAS